MREVWFWRGSAALLVVGWGSSALGWASPAPARRESAEDGRPGHERPAHGAPLRRRSPPATASGAAPASASAAEVTPEALAAAKAELRAALRARHEDLAAERLEHALDAIAGFVADHGLGDRARVALEEAHLAMHARMTALPPPPDPFEEPPPPEVRDAVRQRVQASFEQLDADVLAALDGDRDLADAFRDALRPPGPPGPPGFGPPR